MRPRKKWYFDIFRDSFPRFWGLGIKLALDRRLTRPGPTKLRLYLHIATRTYYLEIWRH